DLLERSFILAGSLTARKARLLAHVLLATRADAEQLREGFARFGRYPIGRAELPCAAPRPIRRPRRPCHDPRPGHNQADRRRSGRPWPPEPLHSSCSTRLRQTARVPPALAPAALELAEPGPVAASAEP